MALVTLTTANTAQALATKTAASNPTAQFFRTVYIENQGPGTVYIGLQKPGGVSSAVLSSTYDKKLLPGDGYTIGLANECDDVDLSGVYCVASADTTIISVTKETA